MAILDNYTFRPLLAIFRLSSRDLKVYLMAILDNYVFLPLLAIFRLSSRELKVLLYTMYAPVVQRSLHTGLIA